MTPLQRIKKNSALLNAIDWEMTPEEAVRLYLEWGNNWAHCNYVIRSKSDQSHYFIVSTWREPPVIYLIRRNSEEACELETIEIPEKVLKQFWQENGRRKGVYAIEGAVKQWLQRELNA